MRLDYGLLLEDELLANLHIHTITNVRPRKGKIHIVIASFLAREFLKCTRRFPPPFVDALAFELQQTLFAPFPVQELASSKHAWFSS